MGTSVVAALQSKGLQVDTNHSTGGGCSAWLVYAAADYADGPHLLVTDGDASAPQDDTSADMVITSYYPSAHDESDLQYIPADTFTPAGIALMATTMLAMVSAR